MTLQAKYTRFRAYQLGNAGSSFSYYDGSHFTLIEARLTDLNRVTLAQELQACNKTKINTLHITSWDQDHCSLEQLKEIILNYKPSKIEYPGYQPHTESGRKCLEYLTKEIHGDKQLIRVDNIIQITPAYISNLDKVKSYGYTNTLYYPREIDKDNANNNSTVKQFRTGCFNVLSLGDVESHMISRGLLRCRTITEEIDIMIIAHHGADNGFTTKPFLKEIRPSVAIVTSNYDNQFEHPKPEIKNMLYELEIPLFTTKTGDVVIESYGADVGLYKVYNLISNSEKISSVCNFRSKKLDFLKQNSDTIKNRISGNKNSY